MSAPWVEQGTLIAAGKALEYRCYGSPPTDAPTFVLLHEGLGCVQLWRDFPAKLAQATGFGVFVYSRAGYGRSESVELPRPLDYMTIEATEVLPVVLDAINTPSVILLGHSDGATIAAIYAGQVIDDRVVGVVLFAPHFFTEHNGLLAIANARDSYDSGDLREKLGKYHDNPDNAFRGWNDSWLSPKFKAWDVRDVLDDIRVPVFTVQGEDDPYGTLYQIDVVKQRVSLSVVTSLILANCQHAPHLEHSDEVISAVASFGASLQHS